jgi:hypothetical protein
MSIATLIIGKSGTGKSAALRNMNPADTLLIQVVPKPLPFRAPGWGRHSKDNPNGNIFVTDQFATIIAIATKTKRKVIVIDDFQYLLANELMRRSDERGFDKFTDIARHGWEAVTAFTGLPDDVRVYVLSHSAEGDDGTIKMKTVGKMLDEKIVLEGLFTIVLRTEVQDGTYHFRTKNNGADTTKTPMGLFDNERIDNDLLAIDSAICEYYEIPTTTQQKEAA